MRDKLSVNLHGDFCTECCDGYIISSYFTCSKCGKQSSGEKVPIFADGEEIELDWESIYRDRSVIFELEYNPDAIDEFIGELESAKNKIIEALKSEVNSSAGCTKERAVDIAKEIMRDALK